MTIELKYCSPKNIEMRITGLSFITPLSSSFIFGITAWSRKRHAEGVVQYLRDKLAALIKGKPLRQKKNNAKKETLLASNSKRLLTLSILSVSAVCSAETFYVERPTIFAPEDVNYIGDSQYFTFRAERDLLRGYSANGKTFTIEGLGVESAELTTTQVIGKGPVGADDECGAWLKSVVERDDGALLGLYHGERDCQYGANPQSTHNTFFALSYDNGISFNSLSHVGVFDPITDAGNLNGVGNATMLEHDGTLHIYAVETDGAWEIVHATADINNPENVSPTTVIGPMTTGSSVTWRGTTTDIASVGFRSCQFLAGEISAPTLGASCPTSGIRISTITDFDQVSLFPHSLVYLPYTSRADRDSSELISSVSIVPVHGGDRWFNDFYLAYTLTHKGNPYTDKRHVKRRTKVVDTLLDAALIRLSSYTDGTTYRTTSDLPTKEFEYMHDEPFYLWSSKQSDTMVPIYEIYAPSINSYLLRRWHASFANRVERVVGWIETQPAPSLIPVYRDYYNGKHGVAYEAGPRRVLLGYAEPG